MKVNELIKELQKHNPNKEVMIQQGEEFDYTTVYTVQEKSVVDMTSLEEDEEIDAIVIEYQ